MPAPVTHENRPAPQLYLVTEPVADPASIETTLRAAMDAATPAAVLLRLAASDERTQIKIAKAAGGIVQPRDIALLIDSLPDLVARAGADGAHLHGIEDFEAAVGGLKPDRIAGAGGLASRHDAMIAAELNADYVMFGEPDARGHRPSLDAILERVAWWAEVFQTPCVAYAATTEEIDALVQAGADFVALDPALWMNDPRAALEDIAARLTLREPAA
jgi:thiamine-phosphate pyrophosphorylase